ncbi:MAG: hypothetical protein HC837_11790 [Chloroflexaceae bacterium]|nr:hypothetical protein [Chloroflexaceae bacterium]
MERQQERPTDLIESSKRKFALSQARFRRQQIELGLLSLQGSIKDGLRAHGILYGLAGATDDWATLLDNLEAASEPLSHDHTYRLRRLHLLCEEISHGDTVT